MRANLLSRSEDWPQAAPAGKVVDLLTCPIPWWCVCYGVLGTGYWIRVRSGLVATVRTRAHTSVVLVDTVT